MVWKPSGIVMIVPTLTISMLIAWRTKHIVAELCHNLAITIFGFPPTLIGCLVSLQGLTPNPFLVGTRLRTR